MIGEYTKNDHIAEWIVPFPHPESGEAKDNVHMCDREADALPSRRMESRHP